MKRGIHPTSALSANHQTLSILSEGLRISRKNCKLQDFINTFSRYIIDITLQGVSTATQPLLRNRFHSAIDLAATLHSHHWKVPYRRLSKMMIERVARILRTEGYHQNTRKRVLNILTNGRAISHLTKRTYSQMADNQPKDDRIQLKVDTEKVLQQ